MSPAAWATNEISPSGGIHAKKSSKLFGSSSSTFSQRGVNAVSLLPTYLADARAVERYSPETPNGALQLGVAENQMLEDLLVPSLSRFGSASFAADCIYYQPTQGRASLQRAFGDYLKRTLKLSRDIDPEGLILGAGCNAVLENLCFTLAEAGEAVLIPTPYYAAFEFDLVARAGLEVLPVNTLEHAGVDLTKEESIPEAAYYPTKVALDVALDKAKLQGQKPRILLLSHPNNPLGVCYPPNVVKTCIEWSRENGIHLISDEIYAGSVYRSPEVFTSAIELAGDHLGPHVHIVYALSKDFALSGLRVGACYSENKEIRLPLQKLNDLGQISSQTQVLVENMVTDISPSGSFWTDEFLEENQCRIRARSDQLQDLLDNYSVPFLKGNAGLFLWMDLSHFLPALDPADVDLNGRESQESMMNRERKLYLDLVNQYGLLFTPGLSMRHERPGFFRFVFTAASDEEFNLALKRLDEFVSSTNC